MWIVFLAVLAAVEFGLIMVGRPSTAATDSEVKSVPTAVRAESNGSTLPSVLPPVVANGATSPKREAAGPAETNAPAAEGASKVDPWLAGIKDEDIATVRDFYFTPDFQKEVRKLKAAGADEVLLAHAVVSQYHRQTEALRWESEREKFVEKYGEEWRDVANIQDKAREQIVGELIGPSVFVRWKLDTELAQCGYGGQALTIQEARQLSALDSNYSAKLVGVRRVGTGSETNGVVFQQLDPVQLLAEYGQRRVEILGPARAAAIR
jgi:ribosomal protein L32E